MAVTPTEAVAGYVVARCVMDQAEILNLAVHPNHTRRRLGTALVQEVLTELGRAGARTVFLEVRASNAGAQAFYAGLGFKPTGRRRGYYADPPEDALILACDIPSR